MKILLTIIIFLSLTSNLYAEISAVGVVGVGYTHISSEVEFNPVHLKGVSINTLTSTTFDDLVAINGNNFYRKNQKYLRVAVPPKSEVVYVLWVKNMLESDLNISSVDAFLSRTNYANGDITKFGINPFLNSYTFNGYVRNSRVKNIEIGETVSPVSTSSAISYLQFTIPLPVEIRDFTWEIDADEQNIYINYSLTVKNNSLYDLCNLEISEGDFSEIFCINKGDVQLFEYLRTYDKNLQDEIYLDGVELFDNNHHYESITSQIGTIYDSSLEGTPLIVNTNVGSFQTLGSLFENLTLELIPYRIKTDPVLINLSPDFLYSLQINGVELSDNSVSLGSDELFSMKISLKNHGFAVDSNTLSLDYNKDAFECIADAVELGEIASQANVEALFECKVKELSLTFENKINVMHSTEFTSSVVQTISIVPSKVNKPVPNVLVKSDNTLNIVSTNARYSSDVFKKPKSKVIKKEVQVSEVKGQADFNSDKPETKKNCIVLIVIVTGVVIYFYFLIKRVW